MAAVMSLPGTAGVIRSGETLGGRTAVTDEQGAFRTVRDMEAKGIQEQIRIDSAVNAYMELIGLPKKMLSEAQLDALKTAYRVYEAKSTPENAAKFMQQVRESIQTASNGMKSGVAVDSAVAETVARLEWVKGNIDSGLIAGDNGISGVAKGTGTSDGKIYQQVEYEGTVKVNGEVRDVSRRVYQRNDIDVDYFDETTGLTNLERMQTGKPPIGSDGNPIQLHHVLQKEEGPMIEIREVTHREHYSQLHGLIKDGVSFRNNPILNKQYNNFRYSYWKWRAMQMIGGN